MLQPHLAVPFIVGVMQVLKPWFGEPWLQTLHLGLFALFNLLRILLYSLYSFSVT